jgi:hypothetical protein
MESNVAKDICTLLLDISQKLDDSLAKVRETSSTQDFERYRRAVGKILGEILLEGLNPLFKEHPELKPPGWYP